MALTNCPECGKQISERAAACPECACPLTPPPLPANDVQTIEQTGKQFKAGLLVGAALVAVGQGACLMGEGGTGMGITLVGFVVILASGVLGWWHHG